MKALKIDSMGNERLPKFITFLLGSSGFMWTINYMMIQTYLLFLYTDVFQISAAYVAVLFLVNRIVDAILAPVFGIFVDRTKTPWGKYKPYFIILGIPFAISGFLTFTDPSLFYSDISQTGKLIYATITYVLFSTIYSLMGAATGGVQPLMTKSLDDRINIGQINSILSTFGGTLIVVAITPLVMMIGGATDSPIGWMTVMGTISFITIIYSITASFFFKEKYYIKDEVKKALTVNQMVNVIFKNKTMLIGLAITLGVTIGGGIRTGVMLYYFQYYFKQPQLMSITGLIGLLVTIAGAVFSGKITKKFGLKKTLVWSVIISIVTGALPFFAPPTQAGIIFFLVTSSIGGFCLGLFSPVQGSMFPAAMDYAEYKYNVSANGFMGSFVTFTQQLATAISGAILAGSLAYIGYQPGPVQPEFTLTGFRLLVSIVPAVLQVFMLAVLWFDLTEDKQKVITQELRDRRDKQNEGLNPPSSF